MIFELEKFKFINTIRIKIKKCEKEHHKQQVVYSTYHDAFTQICFTCRKIRTNKGLVE